MSAALEILRHACVDSAWGYTNDGPPAAEPAAWASLASASKGIIPDAEKPARWLQSIQASDGSVGVTASQNRPAWPTSLAILAWNYLDRLSGRDQYRSSIDKALDWCLSTQGKTAERQSEIGHDPSLRGWSWAAGTHSWLEPTAMFVMALKSAGHGNHPRTREAVRLLVDRLLPDGGCNYGNTMVLGQTLLAHVQPTGLAMMALAGEDVSDPRIGKSLELLEHSIGAETSIASLSFALMGLAAHSRLKRQAEVFRAGLSQRVASCYHAALVVLADNENVDWLLAEARAGEVAAS